MIQRPFNFKKWIDDNRHLLKPPVGNVQVYQDSEFIVMGVGGPNSRKDYHFNEGEEFFYQLEGDVVIKIIEDGKPVDIQIKEGEIFSEENIIGKRTGGVGISPLRYRELIGKPAKSNFKVNEIIHE